jgi:hypothetical protein
MALLKTVRSAQYPLTAEFTFNFNDTMVDINGASQDFGAAAIRSNIDLNAIPLPPNAVVIGGDLTVETAFVGPTAATLSVGDSGSATRYGSAIDLKTAARTPLPLTGFRGNGENVYLRLNTTVAVATAGKATVRVQYIISGRANEAVIA